MKQQEINRKAAKHVGFSARVLNLKSERPFIAWMDKTQSSESVDNISIMLNYSSITSGCKNGNLEKSCIIAFVVVHRTVYINRLFTYLHLQTNYTVCHL